MVDFQSRDTRRGTDDDDEAESPGTESEPTEADQPESADTETASDVDPSVPAGMTFAIVTVSDERTVETDRPGDAVVRAIDENGASVVTRDVVASTYDAVQSVLDSLVGRDDVKAVVTVGGTGVEPDDVTVEAVQSLVDKRLPGFGELFRLLSHEQTGSAIIRTRAMAGVADGVPVFCLPGDEQAAELGANELVVPEAETLASLARGDES
ncbi:molybdenum cofactor biosynthesis protein B [Halobacteriales archaeon Cl-PHB]